MDDVHISDPAALSPVRFARWEQADIILRRWASVAGFQLAISTTNIFRDGKLTISWTINQPSSSKLYI
jgi:hypothetical protein